MAGPHRRWPLAAMFLLLADASGALAWLRLRKSTAAGSAEATAAVAAAVLGLAGGFAVARRLPWWEPRGERQPRLGRVFLVYAVVNASLTLAMHGPHVLSAAVLMLLTGIGVGLAAGLYATPRRRPPL